MLFPAENISKLSLLLFILFARSAQAEAYGEDAYTLTTPPPPTLAQTPIAYATVTVTHTVFYDFGHEKTNHSYRLGYNLTNPKYSGLNESASGLLKNSWYVTVPSKTENGQYAGKPVATSYLSEWSTPTGFRAYDPVPSTVYSGPIADLPTPTNLYWDDHLKGGLIIPTVKLGSWSSQDSRATERAEYPMSAPAMFNSIELPEFATSPGQSQGSPYKAAPTLLPEAKSHLPSLDQAQNSRNFSNSTSPWLPVGLIRGNATEDEKLAFDGTKPVEEQETEIANNARRLSGLMMSLVIAVGSVIFFTS